MISLSIRNEYTALRKLGIRAIEAVRWARTRDRFKEVAGILTRLRVEPECDYYPFDEVSDGLRPSDKKRMVKEIEDRIELDGYWILCGDARASEDDEWECVYSIGGFIGDDWTNSGYDIDCMEVCLDKLEQYSQEQADELAGRATYASGGVYVEHQERF